MSKWYRVKEERGTITLEFSAYTEDDTEETFTVPGVYEVCGHCSGTGRSSAHLGSFTQEEWDQESHEFREDYLNGVYDRECPQCQGKRVVAVMDERAARHLAKYSEEAARALRLFLERVQDESEYEAMCASERRMGA